MTMGIVPQNRWALMYNNDSDTTAGTDRIGIEVDTGGAESGTIILCATMDAAHASDISNLEFWTSNVSDFAAKQGGSGTALSAVVSDGTALCTIASDASNLYSQDVSGTAVKALAVSSNSVTAVSDDGMYVFNVRHIGRYLNFQADLDGAGTVLTVVFIGHDLPSAPWKGQRTPY
ncbi:hypothetical protein LCGC14_1727410 [marine sediment metagenome]|uniref:Uncharacterized protein n=1 Tax=marine sediment metagenome TaxID=412755 RepID=A0A0F9HAD6_9ZZZZ